MRHPLLTTYLGGLSLSCLTAYAVSEPARRAPTPLAALLVLGSSAGGQLLLANACLAVAVLSIRWVQWLVFGPLRASEWQRSWERLVHFFMGQLVLIGAVVDADCGEMLLWSGLAVVVGLLGLYSGICKDRLEYMTHLPEVRAPSPRVSTLARRADEGQPSGRVKKQPACLPAWADGAPCPHRALPSSCRALPPHSPRRALPQHNRPAISPALPPPGHTRRHPPCHRPATPGATLPPP